MSKIGFLTDSCSDIPQELADKYGIEVVGFPINLDGTEYVERKDFTNDQFYEMMRKARPGAPEHQRRRFQHLQQRHQRRRDAGRGAPRP